MLKLEAGKRYERRDGGRSGPLKHVGSHGFCITDGSMVWDESGNFLASGIHSSDLVKEVEEPQPLEWKRGIPTEQECRECWIVSGGNQHLPQSSAVWAPEELDEDGLFEMFAEDEWYIALQIAPVTPPKPKTVTQRQYISETREELWTQHDVDTCWKPTGLTREVQQ